MKFILLIYINKMNTRTKSVKFVKFNSNTEYTTYSSSEYDRHSVEHVVFLKAHNKISDQEMNQIYILLDIYKLYEMKVHKDSFKNNMYHFFKLKSKSLLK